MLAHGKRQRVGGQSEDSLAVLLLVTASFASSAEVSTAFDGNTTNNTPYLVV